MANLRRDAAELAAAEAREDLAALPEAQDLDERERPHSPVLRRG